jgi:hypothetical protein
MHNASLLDITANDAVRLNSTRTRNIDNLPIKTRNDKEAIPSSIVKLRQAGLPKPYGSSAGFFDQIAPAAPRLAALVQPLEDCGATNARSRADVISLQMPILDRAFNR